MSEENLKERFLLLLKLDAESLFERIHERQEECIQYFSLKRDRTIFDEIFKNRYSEASMKDLSYLPIEIIELADNFYTKLDNIRWYLIHTEDMPNTVQDTMMKMLGPLKKQFEMLIFYINAELGNVDDEAPGSPAA